MFIDNNIIKPTKLWRLMTHNELSQAYDNDQECDYYSAYITFYYPEEPYGDPLYSISVCKGMNETHNTNLALIICECLNRKEK